MSEIDLDAIQTRATMATRGPWHVEWDGTGYPQRVLNDAAVLVAETCTGPEWPPTDAEFIAHARDDIPALLAQVEYLRGRIERVLERHGHLGSLCEADEYELREALKRTGER